MSQKFVATLVFWTSITLTLSGCQSDADTSDSSQPEIVITSIGDASEVETADTSVNLLGTAFSDDNVATVSWKNDRGGNGSAFGKERWSTGTIHLQKGRNVVTLTVLDNAGKSNSKAVAITRNEITTTGTTDTAKPVVMYSYFEDLSHAAPIHNAIVDPKPVFLFLAADSLWSSQRIADVRYICCLYAEDPYRSAGSVDTKISVSAPWITTIDASSLQPGSTRQLDIEANIDDTTSSTEQWSAVFAISTDNNSSNTAPTISGEPASGASVGVKYSFLPYGADADSDSLSFSIENKPSWVSFDPATGRLRGRPEEKDVGLHDGITIAVSDGRTSTNLPVFSIDVEASSSGSAGLTWLPPSEREDNTPLIDLAGYQVSYGHISGELGNIVTLDNPSTNSVTIDNLAAGTWKFTIRAYDAQGLFSANSYELTKSIP